jgi:hypothetical protein
MGAEKPPVQDVGKRKSLSGQSRDIANPAIIDLCMKSAFEKKRLRWLKNSYNDDVT